MNSESIGTEHFLKRLMEAYEAEKIKEKRASREITIEEAANKMQTYLNNTPDPLQDQIDKITGKVVHIGGLEGIYYVTVEQNMTLDVNKPVYNLNFNQDFSINWSPKDDTLESFIFININKDSVFNQNPVAVFSHSEYPEFKIDKDVNTFTELYEKICEYEEKRARFLKVRWYREFDETYLEDRVNPDRTFFSYPGTYKMTFIEDNVDARDLIFFYNQTLKYTVDSRIHNSKNL